MNGETFDDAADRKQKPIIKVIMNILSNILIGVLGLFIIYTGYNVYWQERK